MPKDKYEYPQYQFDVRDNSTQKTFNISGDYFEYFLYIMPDTFQSGAYAVSAMIEEQYKPTAFEPTYPPDSGNNTDGQNQGNQNENNNSSTDTNNQNGNNDKN